MNLPRTPSKFLRKTMSLHHLVQFHQQNYLSLSLTYNEYVFPLKHSYSSTFLNQPNISLPPSSPTSKALSPSLSATFSLSPPLSTSLLRPTNPTSSTRVRAPSNSSSQSLQLISTLSFPAIYGRGAKEVHLFAPKLPHVESLPFNGKATTYALPVFALQVTVFPNIGFCIGHSLNHVAADGRSMAHFMKSWASICKSMKTLDSASFHALHLEKAPFHDKKVVKGPFEVHDSHLTSFYTYTLNQILRNKGKNLTDSKAGLATFITSRAHINALKSLASTHFASNEETQAIHASTFVVACAFTWVNLLKVQTTSNPSEDKTCHMCIMVDCRTRKGFEFPKTYFGNCIAACPVTMKTSELVVENGIFAATKAIATEIKKIGTAKIFTGANKWISSWKEGQECENLLFIASSPNFGAYELDLGLGRLLKFQMIPQDGIKFISMADSRNEEGGLEIGVKLNENEMDKFVALSEQGLIRSHY